MDGNHNGSHAVDVRRAQDPRPAGHTCIVAYIDEDGEYEHVAREAVAQAAGSECRLILYDAASASAFTEPIASPVSAEGVGEQFGDPLRPDELLRLGRTAVAGRVEAARQRGVDAWGWLASDHGVDPFLEYAKSQRADLVVLPVELGETGLVERMLGERLDTEALEEAAVTVLLVDRDGRRFFPD
ncbi:MAG TPA: hypothetical protein VGH10_01760 [Actinomycetota bacterium]